MSKSERTELAALWCALFGEAPPLCTDPELVARVLVASLPAAPPYRIGLATPDATGPEEVAA